MNKIKKILLNCSYLDSRSIYLFQVCLGFLSLYRFILALRWSKEFLSPDLFLPTSIVNNWATKWSLFYISPTLTWAIILCIFGIFLSFSLILGYKPRYTLILLWVLTTSLSNRSESIENSGHKVYRLMILWSIFIPSAYLIGIKGLLAVKKTKEYVKVTGLAPILLMSQFMIIYTFAGITKNDYYWTVSYTALYSALHLGAFVKPFGEYISTYPDITKLLTMLTVPIESFMPFLLFIDRQKIPLRAISVLCFLGLPISFFLFFELGIFPFSMLTFATLFIPSNMWNLICGDFILKNKNFYTLIESRFQDDFLKKLSVKFFITIVASLALWDCFDSSFIKAKGAYVNNLKEAVYLTRTDQRWWMFVVSRWVDFWIDVKGTTVSGKEFDLWSEFRGAKDISFNTERPIDMRESFNEQPWNNYIHSLRDNIYFQDWFLFSLCKIYNNKLLKDNISGDKLKEASLYISSKEILGIDKFSEVKTELKKTWVCK